MSLKDSNYTVLITGASGFVGSAIAEYLFKVGYNAVGLYNSSRRESLFPLIKADLSGKDIDEIPITPDIIVHCAGCQPYSYPWFDRGMEPSFHDYLQGNVYVMDNIIRIAEMKKCKRVIYLSTIGVYGQIVQSVMDEGTPRVNADDYGSTKYAGERLLKSSESVEGISLRLPGIIGSGTRGIWVSRVVEKMRRDESIEIYSPYFVTKNFVWINDLARFIQTLIEQDTWKYEELVLGCDKGEKVKDIIEYMKKETNSNSEVIIKPEKRKSFCIQAYRAFEMGYKSLSPFEIIHEYCVSID